MDKLDRESTTRGETNKQLLRTQAELNLAQQRIEKILKEDVWPVKPAPDADAAAFKSDGRIIVVDPQTKIVQLNIGSDNKVYRGLTFGVYDKNQPIARDGKGKAEIEVFSIDKSISAARIVASEIRNPIVVNDIIANLVWDSEKSNTFVVTGSFDLNNDGQIENEGVQKISELIAKWGGTVASSVTVSTDFVVLGQEPVVPRKPTIEELEIYPDADERYERALEKRAEYEQVLSKAQMLSVPIMNTDRFLQFIGYKTQSTKPGAF